MAFHPYPQLIRALFNVNRCGPPGPVTAPSAWPRVDHRVSRLPQATHSPSSDSLSLRIRASSAYPRRSGATRRLIMQKARRRPSGLRPLADGRFQVLFHSPSGVLPTFPSRYWSTVGLPGVFSLAGRSPLLRTGFLVSRPTQVLLLTGPGCPYGGVTLFARHFHAVPVPSTCTLGAALLPRMCLDTLGLGSGLFARRYSGHRSFLSPPAGTGMFRFPAFAPAYSRWPAACRPGCPIRTRAYLSPLAAPRAFSQLAASFIASGSLGIRRPPFVASSFVISRDLFSAS